MLRSTVPCSNSKVNITKDAKLGMMVEVVGRGQRMTAPQFIMAFTMADWEVIKACLRPEACLMPHRPSAAAAAAAADVL